MESFDFGPDFSCLLKSRNTRNTISPVSEEKTLKQALEIGFGNWSMGEVDCGKDGTRWSHHSHTHPNFCNFCLFRLASHWWANNRTTDHNQVICQLYPKNYISSGHLFFLQKKTVSEAIKYNCWFLHLHEILEGLYFHCSLSVCLCVCLCVRISCEQNSIQTDVPIWTRFSLNGCLLHWLKPYWNWWPWVKG